MFALRMVEQGHNRDSLFQMSLYRFCVLPEFPRTYDQRLLGVGPGYGTKGHHYVRTVYVSGGNIEDYDADLRQFPWLFSYNGKMLSLAQFVTQVNILPGTRSIVTLGGQFPTLWEPRIPKPRFVRSVQRRQMTPKGWRSAIRSKADDRARGRAAAHQSRSWRDWSDRSWGNWEWLSWSSQDWSSGRRW